MKSLSKLNIYLFAFFILLGSRSIFTTFHFKNYVYIGTILFAILSLGSELMLFHMQQKGKREVYFSSFFEILFIIFLLAIYMLSHGSYWNDDKGNFMMFLFLFLFLLPFFWIYFSLFGYKKFINAFINIVTIVAGGSIILWLIISILHILTTNSYIRIGWGIERYVPSFHFIYFETQNVIILGKTITRNSSIWPEAPMFAMILCFALLGELYITQRRKKCVVLILTVALLTTFSTSGFLVLFLIFVLNIFDKFKDNKSSKYRFVFSFFVLLVIIPIALVAFLVIKDKLVSSSGSIRLDDYKAGIASFLSAPLVGHGFNNGEYIMEFMDFSKRQIWVDGFPSVNIGLANGWVQILSDGGLILLFVYLLSLFQGIFSSNRSSSEHRMFFIIFVMMFTLAMSYADIYMVFLALPLTLTIKSNMEND